MRLYLSRRGDYAVRAMLALAVHRGEDRLSVRRIAAQMAIPVRFLPQVMRDLVASGLVVSHEGRTGGYQLARPASAISLYDVVVAAEGERDQQECVLRGGPCRRDGICAVHPALTEAREAARRRLAAISLAELARNFEIIAAGGSLGDLSPRPTRPLVTTPGHGPDLDG
jgi:Rrf2 family protein